MKQNRRQYLQAITAGAVMALPSQGRQASTPAVASGSRMTHSFRLGVPDWNLHQTGDPEALRLAARIGFSGIQVSFGRELVNGKLPGDDPAVITKYLEMSKTENVVIDGTCVDRLHDNGLKSDPLGQRWVSDSIRLTKALNTKVLLVPFFGKWAITNRAEVERVGDIVRELAPEAERAGVILGLEDTVSAEDNVRMLDRAKSPNVLVYYDVGNSTIAGFDPVKEIRWLGRDRICQVHLKDNPHLLGEGSIAFPSIVKTLREIGYEGWANLETEVPKGQEELDLSRNLSYLKGVMASAYSA